MTTAGRNWLEPMTEAPIEPDTIICDAHHHLWYLAEEGYSLEDFQNDISGGHRIVQTVFIESRKMLRPTGPPEMAPVGETEFVRKLVTSSTGNTDIAAGIVGYADLTLGDAVAPVLEAHIAAGGGRFKGVRYTTAWDANPGIKSAHAPNILGNPDFRKGFAILAKYNLSFDAWLYHPQLMELAELALAFPKTPILIDHAGGPLGTGPYAKQREKVFQDWKKAIAALAKYDNLYIKLGGLGMGINGFNFDKRPQPPGSAELAECLAPYFNWCIEKFGVNRCMFESNFPVDKKAYTYTVLWNAFKRITTHFSVKEKSALFHDTAAKFYRLPRIK